MSYPWESKCEPSETSRDALLENVWDTFTSAATWPLILSSIFTHLPTVFLFFCPPLHYSFVFLVWLYTFFSGDFLPSLMDNYHVYVDSHLICISSSRTSDPCNYCWVFHLYILQYLEFRVCTTESLPPPFLLPCPLAHRHPQHSLPLVVLRASGYLYLSPRYPSLKVSSIPVQSTIT